MSQLLELLENVETDRSNLIHMLQVVQTNEGYISDDGIEAIAKHFAISAIEVEGVVSFYAKFKRIKPGKFRISVCDGTACHIKGAPLITGWISDGLGINDGETDEAGLFSLETVACLGCCSLAPVISVNGTVFGNLDRRGLLKVIKKFQKNGAA